MAKKGEAREGGTGEHSLPDHGYHQGDGAGFEKGYPKIPYQLYICQPMFSPKSSIISL